MGSNLDGVVRKLEVMSHDMVIIRARQWAEPNGVGQVMDYEKGRMTGYRSYREATEIQVVTTHERLGIGTAKTGLIMAMLRLPPAYNTDPLSDNHWIDDRCEGGFAAVFDSWTDVPIWLQAKPVVFCRAHEPDDDYIPVPLTDPIFLLMLERMRMGALARAEKLMEEVRRTPIEKRGDATGIARHRYHLLHLLGEHRLNAFITKRTEELASNVGVRRVETKDRALDPG